MRMSGKLLLASPAVSLALLAGACGGTKPVSHPRPKASASPSLTPSTISPAATPDAGINPNGPEINPAGDIPDDQLFIPYVDPRGFTVKVPEGWARTEAGGAITFTDKLNSILIQTVQAVAAPTVQSAQANEVPGIATAKGYQAGKVVLVTRKAGAAILITYKADASPDPVTGKVVRDDVERYEFWRGGVEAVLTLSGPVEADNVDPWKTVTDSFSWK